MKERKKERKKNAERNEALFGEIFCKGEIDILFRQTIHACTLYTYTHTHT